MGSTVNERAAPRRLLLLIERRAVCPAEDPLYYNMGKTVQERAASHQLLLLSKRVNGKTNNRERDNSKACDAKLSQWPRTLGRLEAKYAGTPSLAAAKAYHPVSRCCSKKHASINLALHAAHENGMFEWVRFAEKNEASAYGGWHSFKINPSRSKDFVQSMVQGVFELDMNEEAYDNNDLFLGLDNGKKRKRDDVPCGAGCFMRQDWKTLCGSIG